MMKDRAGFVLPVVLVCGLLAVSLVVTFQFISSSDYKQVARLMRSAQATALADLASDEVAAKVNQISWAQNGARPAWVDPLLAQLDGSKASPTINVKKDLGSMIGDCPVTQAQAQKSGLVKVTAINASVGPFQVLPTGGIDQALIYKEDLFGDAGKDLTAWDLRGPMSVEIKISGEGGPLDFARVYRRGQQLAITDTTAPGREFAVMAYLPPHSADYAVQDLQKGGTYNLNATADGRLMFRGPLVLAPEEAPAAPAFPDKPYMGGTDPLVSAGQSQTYPDAKYILSMATVPGPRELQHPGTATGTAGDIGGVDGALFDVKDDIQPRRPAGEKSDSTLHTRPTPMNLNLDTTLSSPCPEDVDIQFTIPELTFVLGEISPVLAKDLDSDNPSFDTIDKEPLAFFPPLAYYYAPIGTGEQKFKFLPTTPATTPPAPFKAVKVSGGNAALFTAGGGQEGDLVTTEPVPKSGGNPQDNVGLIGVYGIAVNESKTYLNLDVLDVAKWLTQKAIDRDPRGNEKPIEQAAGGGITGAIGGFVGGIACSGNPTRREIAQANKDSIAQQALAQLQIDPSVKFLVRRYKVEGGMQLSSGTSASQLSSQLQGKKGAIAPYGAYYHDNNFWRGSRVNQTIKDAIKKGLKDPMFAPTDQAGKEAKLNELLPESGGTQVASLDGGFPDGSSEGKKARDFLAGEYAAELLKNTPASGTSDGGAALNALTAVASKVRGIAEPRVAVKPRPQGAFGPHAAPAGQALADRAELTGMFSRGTFPSKARDWESMATRSYETFDDYFNAEKVGNVLELRGAVLIKTCSSAQSFNYTGRGIIIVVTSDAGQPAKLTGTIAKQGAGSWLTVVHRVNPTLVAGTVPALQLGSRFDGTVLSETGVKPSGQLDISGSLIAGLLNKGASADGDTVNVNYVLDSTGAAMKDTWTVESSGEVSSVDPEP